MAHSSTGSPAPSTPSPSSTGGAAARCAKPSPQSKEWWERLIRGHVAGVTSSDVSALADICIAQGCGIWHAVSVYTGKPCFCAVCNPHPGEYRRPGSCDCATCKRAQ